MRISQSRALPTAITRPACRNHAPCLQQSRALPAANPELVCWIDRCLRAAFLQFLGLFSTFGVRWQTYMANLLNGFQIFNANVETLYLPCAGLAYSGMWLVQAFVVPGLYVAWCLVHLVVSLTLNALAERGLPPSDFLLRVGWRPTRSLSPRATLDKYLPLALRYLNIYYLTAGGLALQLSSHAFSRLLTPSHAFPRLPTPSHAFPRLPSSSAGGLALQLFQCSPSDEGDYLLAAPSITCWSSKEHRRLLGYNVIAFSVFIIAVPLMYVYVVFYRVRKEGIDSVRHSTNPPSPPVCIPMRSLRAPACMHPHVHHAFWGLFPMRSLRAPACMRMRPHSYPMRLPGASQRRLRLPVEPV